MQYFKHIETWNEMCTRSPEITKNNRWTMVWDAHKIGFVLIMIVCSNHKMWIESEKRENGMHKNWTILSNGNYCTLKIMFEQIIYPFGQSTNLFSYNPMELLTFLLMFFVLFKIKNRITMEAFNKKINYSYCSWNNKILVRLPWELNIQNLPGRIYPMHTMMLLHNNFLQQFKILMQPQ